jgi:hypothetical protein
VHGGRQYGVEGETWLEEKEGTEEGARSGGILRGVR